MLRPATLYNHIENTESPVHFISFALRRSGFSASAGPLPFLLLAAVIWSLSIIPLLPRAEAGDVYSYTDEKGVLVITNTPVPDAMKSKARKIESHKKITDEERTAWEKEKADRMKAWRDSQAAEDESRRTRMETEKPEGLRRLESETAEAARTAKETREKAAEVLKMRP